MMKSTIASIWVASFAASVGLWLPDGPLSYGACPSNCSSACKKHDRWCQDPGQYREYLVEVVKIGFCSEQPDEGTPIEFDVVAYDSYAGCRVDCVDLANPDKSTGAMQGDELGTGSETLKTDCSEDEEG